MKVKEHFKYNCDEQIWRILISGSDKLIIEKRDTDKKEVLFDCFDLESKDEIFTDYQFDEKFWIGIEKIYKDIMFLHKFPKPDMPGHKEIIAFDINNQNILWTNEEYAYLFVYDDKVYVFKQQFEGRKYFTLDYITGGLIEELGTDAALINKFYDESRKADDYSDYIFPETQESGNDRIKNIIETYTDKFDIVGTVEYNIISNVLLLSYHTGKFGVNMKQDFCLLDINSGEEIMCKTLADNLEKFMTDPFFVYKNYLFLLEGKSVLAVYMLEG